MNKVKEKARIGNGIVGEALERTLNYYREGYFKESKIEELKSLLKEIDLGVITTFESYGQYIDWSVEKESWLHDKILSFYKNDVDISKMDLSSITSRFLYTYLSCQIILIYTNPDLSETKLFRNPILIEEFKDIQWDMDIYENLGFDVGIY